MKKSDSFEKILNRYTRSDFHDSSLELLSVFFEKKQIALSISHFRDTKKADVEEIVESSFLFKDIDSFELNNKVNQFITDGNISSFTETQKSDKRHLYKIIGTCGWELVFQASSFTYSEKIIGKWSE